MYKSVLGHVFELIIEYVMREAGRVVTCKNVSDDEHWLKRRKKRKFIKCCCNLELTAAAVTTNNSASPR